MTVVVIINLKEHKKCDKIRRIRLEDYKKCLLNNKILFRSQQRFKRKAYYVFTEEVNKIALSSNDDKR